VQQPHRQHHPQHQHHQQLIPSHQQMHAMHHQSLSHPQHLQSPHNQIPHHQPHIHHQSPHSHHQSPHSHHQSPHNHHQSPHNQHILHSQQPQHVHQHMQHMQHPVYGNMLPNDISYQQYPTSMEASMLPQQNVESQKQLNFSPYTDPDIETSKPYRMPPELPYIKSPGMNRKDIKYLESAEDKENAIVVDYNGPLEENMIPKPDENNLYIDESLGITPLSTMHR